MFSVDRRAVEGREGNGMEKRELLNEFGLIVIRLRLRARHHEHFISRTSTPNMCV